MARLASRCDGPKGQVYKFGVNAWGAIVAQHDLSDTTKVDFVESTMRAVNYEGRLLVAPAIR